MADLGHLVLSRFLSRVVVCVWSQLIWKQLHSTHDYCQVFLHQNSEEWKVETRPMSKSQCKIPNNVLESRKPPFHGGRGAIGTPFESRRVVGRSLSFFRVRVAFPGLLRELGSAHDFYSKEDSVRTPTGAGLRPRLLQQGRLRPDSYGSWAPSMTSTTRRTPPGLLRELGSTNDFCSKKDPARAPTGAGLRPRLLPLVSLVQTPTGAGLHF